MRPGMMVRSMRIWTGECEKQQPVEESRAPRDEESMGCEMQAEPVARPWSHLRSPSPSNFSFSPHVTFLQSPLTECDSSFLPKDPDSQEHDGN